ncbi:MAG: SMC-Scp complex subunit ScpB [candidate division KSB1 bacterium]|nr:SMC-Scp complex subunit ScpB [candidate division KSB1 bacterium]
MDVAQLKPVVEAIIFASDGPVTPKMLKNFIDESNGVDFEKVIEALNDDYQSSGRAIQIVRVAGGYQMTTRPEFATWIRKMYMGRTSNRLSRAALETLAIIAFKQPISKAEVAAIRGVNSDGVIKNLLERRLITISGRGEGIGRPLLYSTTPEFLQYFGINDISDLPKPREIEELFGEGKYVDQIIEALSSGDASEEPQEDNHQESETQNDA